MKHFIKIAAIQLSALLLFLANPVAAQQTPEPAPSDDYQIKTLFAPGKIATGGYGAITNKFTFIDGHFANLAGVYGGVYLNHSIMIGVSAAALTNDIRVPSEDSAQPLQSLSYMYGQVGGIMEYNVASDKPIHVAFNVFTGAGFTLQYERDSWHDDHHHDYDWDRNDEDWFFVAEPGVTVEFNVFKWMRFSPGVSYRAAFGSDGQGLGDNAISNISYNLSMKFGRF